MTGTELFEYHLAYQFGCPDVDEMKEDMTARQYSNWQRYAATVGIGPERDDWNMAQLCAVLVNVQPGKDKQPARLTDFLRHYDEFEDDISSDELRRRISLK